mmetsp:Transcript_51218/g.116430  ORF Transcript_51218/g.116430 Transcript_51218/m.116430 type:complete len:176 (+) Transcript_51218:178-705(+)
MPHLHGTFSGPSVLVACRPGDPNSVPLLLDTGATTHVAGSLSRTRLKNLPGVGISTRAVGGGVSASLGQGTLLINFSEATGTLPLGLALFGTGAVNYSIADITPVCAAPIEWPSRSDPGPAPVQGNLVTGAGHALSAGAPQEGAAQERRKAPQEGTAKERRKSRFASLYSYAART